MMTTMDNLSKNELLKLRRKIQSKLDSMELPSESVLLYDAIKKVLWEKCRITVPEIGMYYNKSQALKKLLHDTVIYLDEVIITYKLSNDKRDKSNLYYLFAETVIGYLQRCSVPCTPKNVLVNWDIFLGELDNNFPGYIKSEAFNLILNGGQHEQVQ